MKTRKFLVTFAVYEKHSYGVDILSAEEIQFECDTLEQAAAAFETIKSNMSKALSYDEANEAKVHTQFDTYYLISADYDDEDEEYSNHEFYDSVFERI